ncbi:hypothetical protein [Eubacterium callanderi]|uniref:hypothetical protein n=1 Tax=Eubacterium callanderi TaxID=53442 RepID=UPI001AA1B3E1|nr:hypothetical protein [Eubacterium callanderi]MBO1704032.1 hypothetical protein [Eubacterium callanderi]
MMKRLTEKEQDYYRLKDYQDPCKAIDQLGRYEDIGFSPEEFQQLVDRQKWHVVAEGDLPPKLKDGERAKTYLITKNDTQKYIDFAFWDGEAFGRERKCNIVVSGVLAWRELPEPWEGVNEQCENG